MAEKPPEYDLFTFNWVCVDYQIECNYIELVALPFGSHFLSYLNFNYISIYMTLQLHSLLLQ